MLKTPIDTMLAQGSYDFEPLRRAHYILELRDFEDTVMPEPSKFHIQGLGGLGDEVRGEAYRLFNSDYDVPSGKSFTALDVTIRFFKDKSIYDFFTKWHKAVYDPETDSFGLYDDIVGSGALKLFGPSEQGDPAAPMSPQTALYELTLQDVWPKSITVDALDSEDDGTTPATWRVALSVGMIVRTSKTSGTAA